MYENRYFTEIQFQIWIHSSRSTTLVMMRQRVIRLTAGNRIPLGYIFYITQYKVNNKLLSQHGIYTIRL